MSILTIFLALTTLVVVLVERLEERVLRLPIFDGWRKEMDRVEAELSEYYVYSLLAVAMKDREAYEGFQKLMSDKYWLFFFRKIMLTTSLYFLLLSPYMVAAHYLLRDYIDNAFSWVMFVAITFFTLKLGYSLVRDSYESWKSARKVRCETQNLDDLEGKLK